MNIFEWLAKTRYVKTLKPWQMLALLVFVLGLSFALAVTVGVGRQGLNWEIALLKQAPTILTVFGGLLMAYAPIQALGQTFEKRLLEEEEKSLLCQIATGHRTAKVYPQGGLAADFGLKTAGSREPKLREIQMQLRVIARDEELASAYLILGTVMLFAGGGIGLFTA